MTAKKPEPAKQTEQKLPGSVAPLHCIAEKCGEKIHLLDFCVQHHDEFKFGLLTKKGTKAMDYEKKFEHYLNHKEKQKGSARKIA